MPQVAPPFTPLQIFAGQDWAVPIDVFLPNGTTPADVLTPVMEMRRDPNYRGQLLARLDTTGDADGLLTRLSLGHWTAALGWEFTAQMPPGRGFWQIFGFLDARRIEIDSGVVEIIPRVVA